ncbi:hypothetical protein ACHAW6_012976 [Cyclotella cf. meneghiniana]
MDTRVYEDSCTKELAANAIAEALYAQCDPGATSQVVNGKKVVSRSTRSWELCCKWKDASTSWQKLSDLKESHLGQVAEFAIATGIADEPAFNCWVTRVLKKRDLIISLVKCQSTQYHKRTHKFGIEHLKTVDEAYAINKATGTTFWCDAIELEMKNVHVAVDILADGIALPPDCQYMRCHMIFDVKMEDFCRKVHLVASGPQQLSLIPALCLQRPCK